MLKKNQHIDEYHKCIKTLDIYIIYIYNNSATSYSLKNNYTMKLINIILMRQWCIDAWHLNCYD